MKSARAKRGFTLVEMAFVMVVIGLVMLTVLPALQVARVAAQAEATNANLRSLMTATAAYVQANGCLPCPANPATTGSNFGRVGLSASSTACGSCAEAEGIAPFVSLGLPASIAHDGWGHWISMRVDPALTTLQTTSGTSVFVPPFAACTSTDVGNGVCTAAELGLSAKGFCRSGLATSNRITVATPAGASQQAAVLLVSHGRDGYGSFFAQARNVGNNGERLAFTAIYADCSATAGFARCNADGDLAFIDAPRIAGDSDPYDNVLLYADRNMLAAAFGNGSCQTTW